MARNRIRPRHQTADDLPRCSNRAVGQLLSSFRQFSPLPAYPGVGTGSHQRSTHQRDGDRRTRQRRTTVSRVDPSRREGSRRRPSTASRPGRPPRHCGPDTASRHQQSRPARSDHQARTNTTCAAATPDHGTGRCRMRVTNQSVAQHHPPASVHDNSDGQRVQLAHPIRHPTRRPIRTPTSGPTWHRGVGGTPPVAWHPHMADTGHFRGCNPDVPVRPPDQH
jgi:hypothetical protein